ncbi:Pr6Pr family membrane protein [Streptomyces sp. NPDC032940]|uniref:Pr6Pr family membrane protein n=1 Tax=Streptomyces sp. NPDC032940 TaxID=3155366 RepID=UPI00340CA999
MTAPIPREIPDLPAVPRPPRLLPSPVPASAVLTPVRRPLAAGFRLLTALLALTGAALELTLGGPVLRSMSSFAVQSSIVLALVTLASARRAWSAGRPVSGAVTGAALLYALVAGLVHHSLLANAASPFALADADGTGRHTVAVHLMCTAAPAAAALDWLLLTGRGRLHLRQTATWLLYPLAYLGFSLARGELLLPGTEDRYLYPFLDVDQHGYRGVLGNALLLGLAVHALAVLLVALDHIRPDPLRRRW